MIAKCTHCFFVCWADMIIYYTVGTWQNKTKLLNMHDMIIVPGTACDVEGEEEKDPMVELDLFASLYPNYPSSVYFIFRVSFPFNTLLIVFRTASQVQFSTRVMMFNFVGVSGHVMQRAIC